MNATARPSEHAVLAHLADEATATAALDEIVEGTGVQASSITHGTGPDFADRLEIGKGEPGPATRIVKWLVSLGQEREELARLGQAAREGRHAIVINDVTDRDCLDAIVAVLKRHDAEDIRYIGDWQTEDLSINR